MQARLIFNEPVKGLQVWYCPGFNEIHLVKRVNRWLGGTLVEAENWSEWVPISFPRRKLGWVLLGRL